MNKPKKALVSILDRMARVCLGFITLVFAFALPLTSDWFAGLTLASTYPLLTGVVAWDPFYAVFDAIKTRFVDYHIFH